MTDHYEDADENQKRVLSNRQVLGFLGGYWLRRGGLLSLTAVLTLVSIGFDLTVPYAAGKLVDEVAAGVSRSREAWAAWALLGTVYGASLIIKNVAMRPWIYFASANMKEIVDEAFRKVQAFSADWHADNFAGATVRRLSRAMWGYDTVSDAAVIWLGPAFLVLGGLCVMMALRWPMVGLFASIVVAVFVASNIWLTELWPTASPPARRSNRSARSRARWRGSAASPTCGASPSTSPGPASPTCGCCTMCC
jgi:ATP-binding cassette subfamily B protein